MITDILNFTHTDTDSKCHSSLMYVKLTDGNGKFIVYKCKVYGGLLSDVLVDL